MSSRPVSMKNFWYIVCQSKELKTNQVLSRVVLGEWIVLFRDKNGKACAFKDRCIHRNFKLSEGRVSGGLLQCSYHGWTFEGSGQVVGIPSEGDKKCFDSKKCAQTYEVREEQDLIFVRLEKSEVIDTKPFEMPHYKDEGYTTVRLFNKFNNSVINCVENYLDVPHTVFVHGKIFRDSLNQEIEVAIERKDGQVCTEYFGETDNLGWFSWLLNPKKKPIIHTDTYHMPNVSVVKYIIGDKEFWITSQSIPISDFETWVWTDLTYKFFPSFLNKLVKPMVRFQGQSVIDQDITALNIQGEVIQKYGYNFSNSPADTIHILIESIYNSIKRGKNPLDLPEEKKELKFWI